MNITDLIVELLQNGQRVELPQIGTIDSVTQSPRLDPATQTYYPTTRTIVLREGTTGDNSMVNIIAQRECVGEEVAAQMWNNYIDALTDKIDRTGEHQFGTIGTLSKRGGGYGFDMAAGVVIEAGNHGEKPIEGVKTYDHSAAEDPFAQFDIEEPKISVVQKPVEPPKPAPKPEPEPEEDIHEEEPETIDEEWQENLKKLDDLPKSKAALKAEAKAEKARLKAEAKAEKERAKLRKKAQKQHNQAERRIEEDMEAAARREAKEKRRAEEELRNAEQRVEEERQKAERDAEAARIRAEQKAEEERVKAEKRAAALAAVAALSVEENASAASAAVATPAPEANGRLLKEQQEAEQQAAKEAERRLKAEQKQAKADAKEQARKEKEERKRAEAEAKAMAKAAAAEQKAAAKAEIKEEKREEGKEEEGEKKNRKWLIWLLLLLLLLIAGGALCYFLGHRGTTGTHAESTLGKSLKVSKANRFTFNADMIDYSERDIMRHSDAVCRYMADYINDFLADRGYMNARPQVMDRVRQYAGERLDELMGPRMAVQRFIPYDDYIYQRFQPWMRQSYAGNCRGKVQGELMDMQLLNQMLEQVVDEYGLQPDGSRMAAAPTQAVQHQPAAPAAKQATLPQDDPVYVYVEKKSKQGFDIVAGFYLNKQTAAKMTARLHELGSDAYILEKNDGYYVSMGSAPTRTKAEALYNHIKSWYDGDIVIKQLD